LAIANFRTLSLLVFTDYSFAVAVMAALAIANIVKSSLGPVGLDKMLVDDIGVSGVHSKGYFIPRFIPTCNDPFNAYRTLQ
jgi:hypothetical protein